jgi:hypothetical protein
MYNFLRINIKKIYFLKLKIIAFIFLSAKMSKLVTGMTEHLLKAKKYNQVQIILIKANQL